VVVVDVVLLVVLGIGVVILVKTFSIEEEVVLSVAEKNEFSVVKKVAGASTVVTIINFASSVVRALMNSSDGFDAIEVCSASIDAVFVGVSYFVRVIINCNHIIFVLPFWIAFAVWVRFFLANVCYEHVRLNYCIIILFMKLIK
jgi:hypothetical protein